MLTDAQALAALLTVESFLLAVISLVVTLGAPDRKFVANLDIKPLSLAYGVAGFIAVMATGALAAWCGIYAGGGSLLPIRRLWVAMVLLVAVIGQPCLAVILARGMRIRL